MTKKSEFIIAILLLFTTFMGCEKKANTPIFKLDPPDNLSSDVYEIYSSLLDTYYPKLSIIITPQQTDSTQNGSVAFYLQLDSLGIDSSLISQALQWNKQSFYLDNKFSSKMEVRLLSRKELQYWGSDYQRLFNHYGVYNIFSWGVPYLYTLQTPNRQMAFFSYLTYCGPLCAEWYFVVAEKIDSHWQIIFRTMTAIS